MGRPHCAVALVCHCVLRSSCLLRRALQSEVAEAAKLIQKPAELKAAVMHAFQTFAGSHVERGKDVSMEDEFSRCCCCCCCCHMYAGCCTSAIDLATRLLLQADGAAALQAVCSFAIRGDGACP